MDLTASMELMASKELMATAEKRSSKWWTSLWACLPKARSRLNWSCSWTSTGRWQRNQRKNTTTPLTTKRTRMVVLFFQRLGMTCWLSPHSVSGTASSSTGRSLQCPHAVLFWRGSGHTWRSVVRTTFYISWFSSRSSLQWSAAKRTKQCRRSQVLLSSKKQWDFTVRRQQHWVSPGEFWLAWGNEGFRSVIWRKLPE